MRNRCHREEPRSGDVAISPKPTGLLRSLRGLAVTAIPLQRTVNWYEKAAGWPRLTDAPAYQPRHARAPMIAEATQRSASSLGTWQIVAQKRSSRGARTLQPRSAKNAASRSRPNEARSQRMSTHVPRPITRSMTTLSQAAPEGSGGKSKSCSRPRTEEGIVTS